MNPLETAIHNNEPKIGFSKRIAFGSTPKEFLKTHRACFKAYCQNDMAYDDDEVRILMRIYDMQIGENNIMKYLNSKANEIYIALINDKLDLLAGGKIIKKP